MAELKKTAGSPEFKEAEETVTLKASDDGAGLQGSSGSPGTSGTGTSGARASGTSRAGPSDSSSDQNENGASGRKHRPGDEQSNQYSGLGSDDGSYANASSDAGLEAGASESDIENHEDPQNSNLRPNIIDLDKPSFSKRNNSRGYVRHRIILAICFIFSASIVALSAMDLKPLIERVGYIDKTGHVTFQQSSVELPPNISFDRQETGENLRAIMESTWSGERYGFADESGKIVIKPKFSNVTTFHDGLAAAKPIGKDPKYGYIDKKGKWKIPAKYDNAVAFTHGVGAVLLDGEWSIIDSTGKVIGSADNNNSTIPQPAGNGLVLSKGGNYGFVTAKGFALKPEYDSIKALKDNDQAYFYRQELFSDAGVDKENFLLIGKGGKYGVADANGKIFLDPKYDDIKSYNRGYAVFEKRGTANKDQYDTHGRRSEGDQYGMLKPDGSTFIEAKYDSITPYDDLIALTKDGDITFIDAAGKPVSTPKIQGLVTDSYGDWLKDGLGGVVIDNKIYFINTKGQLAFARGFQFATPFQEGFSAVWDGKWWRYINTRGENVFHKKFGKLELFNNGKAKVTLGGPLYGFTHPGARRNISNSIKNTFTHEKPEYD